MELAAMLEKLELHRRGIRQLHPEEAHAIDEALRAGLMLYGFIRAKSAGKNLPCERYERATLIGVANVQHALEIAELKLGKEAV